jgi:hypothetical protein
MKPPTCLRPHASDSGNYRVNESATIRNRDEDQVNDPSGLALAALAWVLGEPARANRFLDLTGLTPDGLRAGLSEGATHRAVLEFICAHEPDLLAASESLEVAPGEFALALDRLER